MIRFIHIIFFTLVGFILTQTDIYACGSKSNETELCNNKSDKASLQKKDCCDTEKGQCGKNGKGCNGKCGNPACHCPTNSTNFTIPLFDGFLGIKIIVSKPNFYYQDTYYSSGFLSIWQPPKIG
jgi:hypothetical protein